MRNRIDRSQKLVAVALAFAGILVSSSLASAVVLGNAACPGEQVIFDPGRGQDIIVPPGYKVEVFASGLNFPTGIAFKGNDRRFEVFVTESGTGVPGQCNGAEFFKANTHGAGRSEPVPPASQGSR